METFFYKYRKPLKVIYYLLLIAFPFKIYNDIGFLIRGGKWQAIGRCVNDLAIYLLLPLYVLGIIYRIRKRNEKEALGNSQNPDTGVTK